MLKNFFKIKYTKHTQEKEIGWAKKKTDNQYTIENIPYIPDNLNIDDVVTLSETKDDDGLKCVDKIVKRKFHSKTIISYSEIADYKLLKNKHDCSDFKIEAAWQPKVLKNGKFEKGMAIIASNCTEHEINEIIKTVGAKIISHIEML